MRYHLRIYAVYLIKDVDGHTSNKSVYVFFKVQQFLYLFRAVTSSPTCQNKEHVEHISTHIIPTQTHRVCSRYHFRKNAQNVGTGILSVLCQTRLMMPNSSIQSCCCYMRVCVVLFKSSLILLPHQIKTQQPLNPLRLAKDISLQAQQTSSVTWSFSDGILSNEFRRCFYYYY